MFETFLYAGTRHSKVVGAYSSTGELWSLSRLMKASLEGVTLSFDGYLVHPAFDGREQMLKALETLPKKSVIM